MKIVLTGASGAIGPPVAAELAERHQLTLFSRRRLDSGHHQVVGDLTSLADSLGAVQDAEAIVHLAAYSEPAPDAFRFNMLSTYALLEAARQAEVPRFIFASTNCVYGHCYRDGKREFPLQYLPIDENHPCVPENNYGVSKLLGEELLATYSRTWGMRTAGLRLNWVWGPKEIDWRRHMDKFDLARYAGSFWAYVDARDCANAFRLAVEAPDLPLSGAYNISAADQTAGEATMALVERFYPGARLPRALVEQESLFDWQRAQQAFGYAPRYSWTTD